MSGQPIPVGYAWRYLQAVYEAGAPLGPSRLAAVLVNLAYATGSLTVPASEALLRSGTALRDGRNLTRALAWLVEHGFVARVSVGRGRRASTWALAPAPER